MRFSLLATAAFVLLQSPLIAVTTGQIQTFDDPNHHWTFGGGFGGIPPTQFPLALGGPGGPTDPYLSLVSTGIHGPNSRLSAQNFVEWAGDYSAFDRILMDQPGRAHPRGVGPQGNEGEGDRVVAHEVEPGVGLSVHG